MCEEQCFDQEYLDHLIFKQEQEQPLQFDLPLLSFEELARQTLGYYEKLSLPYGGLSKVCVGTITHTREVYASNRIYATIDCTAISSTPDDTACEGYLDLASSAEVATVGRRLYFGSTLVIDRESKQILEAAIY